MTYFDLIWPVLTYFDLFWPNLTLRSLWRFLLVWFWNTLKQLSSLARAPSLYNLSGMWWLWMCATNLLVTSPGLIWCNLATSNIRNTLLAKFKNKEDPKEDDNLKFGDESKNAFLWPKRFNPIRSCYKIFHSLCL